ATYRRSFFAPLRLPIIQGCASALQPISQDEVNKCLSLACLVA
ncbi:hypothetical protein HMPREF1556_01773, partial [Porphyromonas sp. oral taxon 278 str. W7784]